VIRDYTAGDTEQIVAISLRAWEPIFASVAAALGRELDTLLHGEDWRTRQERDVRETLARDGMRTWVADDDGVAGFASAHVVDPDRAIGELAMLAVDPGSQRHGLGAALTEVATDWLREQGMRVAFIATGGDEGHAPARRLYARAGYTPFPVVQFYKRLST